MDEKQKKTGKERMLPGILTGTHVAFHKKSPLTSKKTKLMWPEQYLYSSIVSVRMVTGAFGLPGNKSYGFCLKTQKSSTRP